MPDSPQPVTPERGGTPTADAVDTPEPRASSARPVTAATAATPATSATAGPSATAGIAGQPGPAADPLTPGGLVPHFDLVDVDGRRRRYTDVWQHRLLALVLLPEAESAASRAYQDSLADLAPALAEMNTTLVVAAAAIEGLTPPGWLVADQFGEIQHVQQARDGSDVALPSPDELLQWVRYVRSRCG